MEAGVELLLAPPPPPLELIPPPPHPAAQATEAHKAASFSHFITGIVLPKIDFLCDRTRAGGAWVGMKTAEDTEEPDF
jgi:hypothetical protein